MSWAAHELESYVLGRHIKTKISYLAVLVGCLAPDMLTKLPVYGFELGPLKLEPQAEPWNYHRGWVGVGPSHSLMFGVIIGVLVLWIFRSRAWALGLMIGQWAHALTDICDSTGTMLFFPFTTQRYSVNMWAYAAQQGKFGDADAYYSSLGGVWDAFWLLIVLMSIKVLSRRFFFEKIVPDDPVWAWMHRRLKLSPRAMLAIYRAYFFYAVTRIIAWFGIARFRSRTPLDLTWGGPGFVHKAPVDWNGWGDFLLNSARGIALFVLVAYLVWRFVGLPLWKRAGRHEDARARTPVVDPA